MDCRYDGNRFVVQSRGEVYGHSVSPNFKNYKLACGATVAALYDGMDFIVFDASRGSFDWRAAKRDYPFSLIQSNFDMAALYDGETFLFTTDIETISQVGAWELRTSTRGLPPAITWLPSTTDVLYIFTTRFALT